MSFLRCRKFMHSALMLQIALAILLEIWGKGGEEKQTSSHFLFLCHLKLLKAPSESSCSGCNFFIFTVASWHTWCLSSIILLNVLLLKPVNGYFENF